MPTRPGEPQLEQLLRDFDQRFRELETHQHHEVADPMAEPVEDTDTSKEYATVVIAWSDTHESGKERADVVATGTGDQAAIAEALTLLPATGGEIVMLEGTAVFSATLTINVNNVHLRGMGAGTVFNRTSGLATYFSIQADRVRLSDFRIVNPSTIADGISITSTSDDVTVTGVHFEHLNTGVAGGGIRTRVEGCTFINCSTCINISNSAATDGVVTGCTARSSVAFQPTFARVAAERWTISTNTARGFQAGPTIHLDGSHFSSVVGNIIECTPLPNGTTTRGILSSGVSCSISGNVIRGANAAGIVFTGLGSSVGNNSIYEIAEGPGISFNASESSAAGNSISLCRTGILLSNTQRSTVSGNLVYFCDRHGIEMDPGAFAILNNITGNSVIYCGQETDNTYDGIFLGASGGSGCDFNNIQSNLVVHTNGALRTRYGINISSSACDGNLVTNNMLRLSGATASLNDAGTGTVTTAGNYL